jgi:hypothetical protein
MRHFRMSLQPISIWLPSARNERELKRDSFDDKRLGASDICGPLSGKAANDQYIYRDLQAMSKKKTLTTRDQVLKKQYGGVHPERVDDYIPTFPIDIPATNNEKAYGLLTDSSTYSEYAWAFLKRNRFYQSIIDKRRIEGLAIEHWGYFSNEQPLYPYALIEVKPYKEEHGGVGTEEHDAIGTKVEWCGIHGFLGQLRPLKQPRPRMAPKVMEIEFPKHQVGLIFDIGPTLGDNTTGIDQQIAMARIHLHELAEAEKFSVPRRRKNRKPDKTTLRDQLRVADLLSSPSSISVPNNNDRTSAFIPVELSEKSPLNISDVADLLSSFERHRAIPDGGKNFKGATLSSSLYEELSNDRKESKKQLLSRMSALSVDAWDNIYNWRFLNWLQFDDWSHLMVLSKTKRIQSI